MNDVELQQWLEAARSGRLKLDELQSLARQRQWPEEVLETLRLEVALSQALAEMPPVPVSSNFTHRVMEAVERQPVATKAPWCLWLRRCWPRLAVPAAAAAAVAIYLSVNQHQASVQRAQWAASVHAVATLAAAPATAAEGLDLDVWENFDVILRMGSLSPDTDLLKIVEKSQ